MLAELRMLETVRQMLDRDVLETYPLLTELLEVREEPSLVIDLVTSDLRQRLAQSGWRGQYVETPYVFTHGRVFIRETSTQHGRKLRVDALLRAEPSLPIAVVQTIHAGQAREDVIRRLTEYAHYRLAVPFAYLPEEDGTIQEFDWTATDSPVHAVLTQLPARDALWNRWAEEWGVLKVGTVSFGVYQQFENKALPAALEPRPEYEVHSGDFLMSRANTTNLVGVCALVKQTRPKLMLSDKIFRFVFR